MPLKLLPLRRYFSLQSNISSFITLSTLLYEEINEGPRYMLIIFLFFPDNVPLEVLT